MTLNDSSYRLIENEIIFREFNENVQKRFDELTQIASDDNQEDVITESDLPLHFYCECSDENCRQRIQLKPRIYNSIHEDRRSFTIVPEHNVGSIEKVITKEDSYWVVRKNLLPPKKFTKKLKKTDVDNI